MLGVGLAQARAAARHGQLTRPAPSRATTLTGRPAGRGVRAFSTRLPIARASASASPRTVTGAGAPTSTRAPRARQREHVEPTRSSEPGAGRVLAGEREQVVEQVREPLGVVLEIGQHLGVRAVLRDVGGVAAQRGQRRPQLVRRVGDEAALGLARALERREHRVQRLGERADLVLGAGRREALRRSRPSRRSRARAAESRPAGAARGG